jgi:F0F1-type ATP synthase alpha subunit
MEFTKRAIAFALIESAAQLDIIEGIANNLATELKDYNYDANITSFAKDLKRKTLDLVAADRQELARLEKCTGDDVKVLFELLVKLKELAQKLPIDMKNYGLKFING